MIFDLQNNLKIICFQVPIIYEATVQCANEIVQQEIIQFSIEALKKYGVNQVS